MPTLASRSDRLAALFFGFASSALPLNAATEQTEEEHFSTDYFPAGDYNYADFFQPDTPPKSVKEQGKSAPKRPAPWPVEGAAWAPKVSRGNTKCTRPKESQA